MATTKKTTTTTTLKNKVSTLTEENNTLRTQKDALLGKVGGLRAHIVQTNITATTEILRLLELIIKDS